MLKIEDALLTVNEYSRPGWWLKEYLGVVMHWTANAGVNARANRTYFENRKKGQTGYGSAHYIVGLKGEVLRCVPEGEIAYHCGSSSLDPVSGRVYTDLARELFGVYCERGKSPNHCTVGVELCNVDGKGNFTDATLESAAELVADILKRRALPVERVVTHHDVVGWKDCPRLWTVYPERFVAFKARVAAILGGAV